jgi:hypothetical protein
MALSAMATSLAAAVPLAAGTGPALNWQVHQASAAGGQGGTVIASQSSDTNAAAYPTVSVVANAMVDTPVLFAGGFANLQSGVVPMADGGLQVTVVAFGDLWARPLTSTEPVFGQADAYFQLELVIDQPYPYTLAVTNNDITGAPGVTGSSQFLAFNDPEGDGQLVPGQVVQLYGQVKHTLTAQPGQNLAAYPELYATLTLAPVPEPGTWAMALAGLVGVGGVALRRRRA